MRTATVKIESRAPLQIVLLTAWIVTLLVSTLPNIPLIETRGTLPVWIFWAKAGLLAVTILVGFLWQTVKPLQKYFFMLLVILIAERIVFKLDELAFWSALFGGAGFTKMMFGDQTMRLSVSLIVIAGLLALKYRPKRFFLVKGDLNALTEPVRWLGIAPGTSWKRLGIVLSLVISLGTLTFLVIAGRPSLNALGMVAPLLPAVLILAALNAFNEELTFRAALLTPLEPAVGSHQAILLTAAFFGLGHYYGVPYGVIGVLMAGFLGWLLGKSMLETRGFFWPWFIHFLQDVMIFSFMGIGSIVAGGG